MWSPQWVRFGWVRSKLDLPHMSLHGSQWVPMGPHGSTWAPMGQRGPKGSLVVPYALPQWVRSGWVRSKLDLPHLGPNGSQWVPMGPRGSLLVPKGPIVSISGSG